VVKDVIDLSDARIQHTKNVEIREECDDGSDDKLRLRKERTESTENLDVGRAQRKSDLFLGLS
jgi:hypothetical protein